MNAARYECKVALEHGVHLSFGEYLTVWMGGSQIELRITPSGEREIFVHPEAGISTVVRGMGVCDVTGVTTD